MLYCPNLSFFSFSNRFAGGIRKSLSFVARFSILSFLKTILCSSAGIFFDPSLLKSFSACLSLKVLITIQIYIVYR